MNLPRLSIQNYQFTLVVFAGLIMMGIISFFTMPRTEDPPLNLPGASVFVVYPGASPADLEELVVNPIEEALNELNDIKRVETSIGNGLAVTSVEFHFGTDENRKYDEVVRQVNRVRDELPEGIYSLETYHWSSSDVVIMQLALVSEESGYPALQRLAEDLKKELDRVPGVMLTEILAVPGQEVRVSLDMEKMARMNIPLDRVAGALAGNNAQIPAGSIRAGDVSFNAKTSGRYHTLDEIRHTVVGSYMGRNILLGHIATVAYACEDNNYLARFNGRKCIYLTVKQKRDYNVMDITEGLREQAGIFRESLPPGVELEMVFDQSDSVRTRVNGFLENLAGGILLVGILIFLSLGWRASLVVIMAIPFSIFIGLGWVDLAGFGLQQITIAALVIALGLLVDNSIVVTENIERFHALGYRGEEAAVKGTTRLAWPVVSATATTMCAFIPIIMMPDKAGKFIQSLPVTVIFTLFASLLLALTLTPYLGKVFLRPPARGAEPRGFKKLIGKMVEGPYRKTLGFALRHAWLVVGLSLLALGASVWLFYAQVGRSFFPKAEKPQFMIRINAPENASLQKTDRLARQVEEILDTLPDVKRVATNVGHGNPRIYYNIFPRQFDRSYAEIYVELHEYEVERFDYLVSRLRTVLSRIPGARIHIKELEQGAPIEAPLTLKIMGEDLETLRILAAEVETVLRATPGAVNVENHSSRQGMDLYFDINREKAGMYGIPVQQIDLTIRTAIAGTEVTSFRTDEGKEYPVVLRMPEGDSVRLSHLDRIHITSVTGRQVPLRQLAAWELRRAPGVISHTGLERCATLTADIEKGYFLDQVIDSLEKKLEGFRWPAGYTYKYTGELESREESFAGVARASLLAVLAILAILVLQFRSFTRPFIIFTALPLAFIGACLGLYLTGNSFSFTAAIGFISLIGIVVNNSILLVDYTTLLTGEGKGLKEAIMEAGETRFRPIVLTTLTTVGGLLPLTLRGGTLWAPMGWTIIGGLLVSTFLTLIVVPALYLLFTRFGRQVESITTG